MYARGMTMREIQGFLRESYATEVSAEFISSVTEAVRPKWRHFDGAQRPWSRNVD